MLLREGGTRRLLFVLCMSAVPVLSLRLAAQSNEDQSQAVDSAHAANQTSPVATLFNEMCMDAVLDRHPACPSGSDGDAGDDFRWLLMAHVCAGQPRPSVCERFEKQRSKGEPCVLAYSHRAGQWRPESALARSESWQFDTDVNGRPTVVASRSNSCITIIRDTIPLTYAVRLGAIQESDTELVSGLTNLAGVLGGAFTSAAGGGPATLSGGDSGIQPTGAPETPGTAERSKSEAFTALRQQTRSVETNVEQLAGLKGQVVAMLNFIEANNQVPSSNIDWPIVDAQWAEAWIQQFNALRLARRSAIEALGNGASTGEKALLDQAQALLDRQTDVAKVASSLIVVRRRWDRYVVDNRLVTWMVAPVRPNDVAWAKDQTYTLTIDLDSPFSGEIVRTLPKVETSVRFTSPRSDMFGVAIGLIVTPLEQTTYKALGLEGKRVIAESGRDSRTGQLALFLDWRAVQAFWPPASVWAARPALQFGAALDTDEPGFFLGGSIEVTKWLRLAAGRTWQQVMVLDGQAVNDPVENDDAIRLRESFAGARYFSVSLAIDGLPFFKAD